MEIKQINSPNKYNGRNGWIPDLIVCHITEGNFEGAVSWLCKESTEASSHFVVAKDGRVVQLVPISDGSWCNGTSNKVSDKRYYKNSTLDIVKERKTNANYYTVTIEHEAFSKDNGALTEEQTNATIELIKYIKNEVKKIYGTEIILDRNHIVGHYEINPITKPNCPGNKFPFDKIIKCLNDADLSNDQSINDEIILDVDTRSNITNYNLLENINEKSDFLIDGKLYSLNRILENGFNFIKISDLKVAGFNIEYNEELKIPVINSPSKDSINAFNFKYEDIERLAKIVWAEARGENEKGQILVVNVVLNRLKNKKYPDSVYDVLYQENQFQPIRDGSFLGATPNVENYIAVIKALCGEDYSQGALFFRSIMGSDGSWHENNLKFLFEFGGHRFYL